MINHKKFRRLYREERPQMRRRVAANGRSAPARHSGVPSACRFTSCQMRSLAAGGPGYLL